MIHQQGRFQRTQRAGDPVLDLDLAEQIISSLHLLGNQLGGDILEVRDRRLLGDAEGDLVRELEERADGLGAFAVESADGQSQLAQVRADAVYRSGDVQSRQMEHDGRAHAGAEVGRTLGQVAELLVEREAELSRQLVIKLVRKGVCLVGFKAVADDLQTDMILFVDHDGDGVVVAEEHGSALFLPDKIRADQVAFEQCDLHGIGHGVEVDPVELDLAVFEGVGDLLDDLLCLIGGESDRERNFAEVTREAHSGGYYRFAHGYASISLILSRSSAARSKFSSSIACLS